MTIEGPKILFVLFGTIPISETVFNSWLIIAGVFILCKILTSNMKIVPATRRQALAELAVTSISNLVYSTMGKKCAPFIPYIATLFTFSVFGSLISLLGLRSITADVNVVLTWALLTFILTQYNGLRTKKLKRYLKSFTEPVFVITPLNLISEFANVISLTFRHFGNILAGLVITKLIYYALSGISGVFQFIPFLSGLTQVPIFQVGLPAFLSLYFDLFTAALQAFIFSMLSMIYISGSMDENALN